MINIFVTHRCNMACDYCFARGLRSEFPEDMSEANFERLLAWMRRAEAPAAGFLGGEPGLHPRLADMLEATADAGVSPVLFTNGLMDAALAKRLAERAANIVVNANHPDAYTADQYRRLHETLAVFAASDARLTFSKNFTSARREEYAYLIEDAKRYGVRAVRYDISRPSAEGGNAYVDADHADAILAGLVAFVRECEDAGVRTGLDCAVRLCGLPAADRAYLARTSMKFTGICHPSIDIQPDLSASYCLPLKDVRVPDATAFANVPRLMQHFSEAVRRMRYANASEDCAACPDFKRFCQGGCMALKRRTAANDNTNAAPPTAARQRMVHALA